MVFQERTYSVLVVSASEKFNSTIKPLLPVTDYWPVSYVGSVSGAKRKLLEQPCDILIVNTPLPDDFGTRLAIDVCNDTNTAVLLLVKNELFNDVYSKVVEFGVTVVSKPTSAQMVSQCLRGLCAIRERLRKFEERQATVEEKIEEIRLINRAKWHWIECLSMTEAEAHRYIEKQSMDLRISKREVAENIIKTYQ